MSDFPRAIDDLISQATAGGTLEDLQRRMMQAHQHLASALLEERDGALRRMSENLLTIHPVPGAKLAMTCGAVVERGGDPLIAGPAVLEMLPAVLTQSLRFHQLCREKARTEGLIPEEGDPPPMSQLAEWYFGTILEEEREAAWGYSIEQDVSLAAISHLARSKQLRARAREMSTDLISHSVALDEEVGGRSFLTKMLMVLDDEPILVLDTDQHKGYRIRISGIPDNFQLHAVLMAHLFGDPEEGWIEASGFDFAALRRATEQLCGNQASTVTGAFQLWNWTGLQEDGSLPEPDEAREHWIWNEGVPADIVPFEGLRVIILGQPPYARSWRAGMIFDGMPPELVVEEKLSEEEVLGWFRHLASGGR